MILLDNLPKLSQNILPISGFITRDSPMSSGIHMVRTAYQRCTVFLDRRPLRMCHRCITVIFKTVICRKFNIMLSQNRYQLTDPVLFQATMDFSDFLYRNNCFPNDLYSRSYIHSDLLPEKIFQILPDSDVPE